MNALRIRHVTDKVHILLLNNQGGEEFYYNQSWKNEASDLHTTARHHTKAEGWTKECGFRYLSAHNEDELANAIDDFFDDTKNGPVLLEVFTEMASDSKVIYDMYDLSRPRDVQSEAIRKSKDLIKATIGQDKAQHLVNLLRR